MTYNDFAWSLSCRAAQVYNVELLGLVILRGKRLSDGLCRGECAFNANFPICLVVWHARFTQRPQSFLSP